jgi:hypothetical protein
MKEKEQASLKISSTDLGSDEVIRRKTSEH